MAGRLITLIFAISLLSVCPLTPAGAIPITVSFTAVSFTEFEESPPGPPTDPVTGSIVYDAASTTSNINALTSINLTSRGTPTCSARWVSLRHSASINRSSDY